MQEGFAFNEIYDIPSWQKQASIPRYLGTYLLLMGLPAFNVDKEEAGTTYRGKSSKAACGLDRCLSYLMESQG